MYGKCCVKSVQNLDVEEVTNSVNNSWNQEQTFQKMSYTVHSYGQLMKTV